MTNESGVRRVVAFGAELRRLRIERGLSLRQMADRTYFTKGYLSKVENGLRRPSITVAKACDAVFELNGRLMSLVLQPEQVVHNTPPDSLDTDDGRFTGPIASVSPRTGVAIPQFRSLFDATRRLGQETSPVLVLPIAVAQSNALCALVTNGRHSELNQVATLAARYAEYAGWMAQEAGDVRTALWWTRRAAEIAAGVGDREMAAYSLVRQALITMYAQDSRSTVDLARRAQADSRSTRILGLAALREGQGLALAGNHTECMRALDRARDLLAVAATEQSEDPVVGTSNVCNPTAIVTGWCLYELGRPAQAAAIFDTELVHIPCAAPRSWARYTARQALAHATIGDVARACELTLPLLEVAGRVDSATIALDLRRLASTLRRWHDHTAVRHIDPLLTDILCRPAS